jgi:hypothetical protein
MRQEHNMFLLWAVTSSMCANSSKENRPRKHEQVSMPEQVMELPVEEVKVLDQETH